MPQQIIATSRCLPEMRRCEIWAFLSMRDVVCRLCWQSVRVRMKCTRWRFWRRMSSCKTTMWSVRCARRGSLHLLQGILSSPQFIPASKLVFVTFVWLSSSLPISYRRSTCLLREFHKAFRKETLAELSSQVIKFYQEFLLLRSLTFSLLMLSEMRNLDSLPTCF